MALMSFEFLWSSMIKITYLFLCTLEESLTCNPLHSHRFRAHAFTILAANGLTSAQEAQNTCKNTVSLTYICGKIFTMILPCVHNALGKAAINNSQRRIYDMMAVEIVTAMATVPMVPITTVGTSTGYIPLPSSCVVIGGEILCAHTIGSVLSTASTTSETNTIAVLASITSSPNPSDSLATTTPRSLSPTTSSPPPSSSSSSSSSSLSLSSVPSGESATAAASTESGSNQVALALGSTFTLLAFVLTGWLVFAWKTKRFPFKRKDPASEEGGQSMKEVDERIAEDLKGFGIVAPMPRESPQRPVFGAPSTRPPSSRYSQEVDSEKKFEGPYEAWTDSSSIVGRQGPQVARDFISGDEVFQGPCALPPARPYSDDSFGSLFHPIPPTPPPTSPLPSLALTAALSKQSVDRRGNVCRGNFPDNPVIAQERGLDTDASGFNWFGLERSRSNWSLRTEAGSRPSLKSQLSDESDVARSELHRTRGTEYLYQTREVNNGEGKSR